MLWDGMERPKRKREESSREARERIGERREKDRSVFLGQSSPEGLSVYSMERGVRYPSLTDCYSCEAHSIM